MNAGLPTDARGVVQLEFLLVIVPLFLLLVGLTQLVLLQVAQLVVQHAAERGVRSAVVILNDTSDSYDGADPGEIGGAKGSPHSARYLAIERAVRWPLHALAQNPTARLRAALGVQSMHDAVDGGPVAALASASLETLASATTVSFPIGEGSDETHEGMVPIDGQVHLRVEHRVECLVPLARNLICDHASKLPFDLRRVMDLTGEATLPSQWASYDAESRDAH
jgi:hypothetical protein